MNYKIVEKESFTVFGVTKMFDYQNCKEEIPVFGKSIMKREMTNMFVECLELVLKKMWDKIVLNT